MREEGEKEAVKEEAHFENQVVLVGETIGVSSA